MTDEQLIDMMKKGMRLRRSSVHSTWYGVLENFRHTGDRKQIGRLLHNKRIKYTGPLQLEVKLNEKSNSDVRPVRQRAPKAN